MINLENLPDEELEQLAQQFTRLSKRADRAKRN